MYIGLSRTSVFPTLTHVGVVAPIVEAKSEIRLLDQPNGTQVYCYLVSAEGTFDCPLAREARGTVFKDTQLVARPLHKFFNVNEREETRAENLDWSQVVRVMDKRDGSMIHTVNVRCDELATAGYTFDLKSKKSFTSDVALAAKELALADPRVLKLCQAVVDLGATAIFEYTAPTARIVLAYSEPRLTLLHVRDNYSGQYWELPRLRALTQEHDVPLVDQYLGVTVEELLSRAETETGIEGWVIQFKSGEMVKLKTKWYLERHRAMTFLRERDIARLALCEQLDDLKSILVGEGVDLAEILRIEEQVTSDVGAILDEVERIYALDRELSRKDFALKHTGSAYFGLLMNRYTGKEPNVAQWYERFVLDDKFGLTQLNLLQSVGEPE